MKLTILMPCYNEEKTISYAVADALLFLQEHNIDGEVLVADNCSTDNSYELAKRAGARVIRVMKKGYGYALRAGIKKARGKYIIFGDSDLSYKMCDIYRHFRYLEKGYDAVLGNRYWGEINKDAQSFSHRYIGVPILSFLGRLKYKCDIYDFHCGQQGFNTEFVRSLNLISTGFEFSTELIGKTCQATSNYIQIPVTLHKDGRDRPSNLDTIKDGLRHLSFILFDRVIF